MAKIEKTKSGNYTTRVVVGHDENGTPIRKRFTHYDKAKLRLMIAKYEDSHRVQIRRQTVGQAIDDFLAAKSSVLSPSTLRAYNSLARTLKAENERLCASYADALKSRDIQDLINEMVEKGLTQKTIRNYHGFLSAVWKYAGLALPPVNLPRKERPDISIPDEDAVKEILTAAKGTRLEIPLALATMGLRRSEICALTIDDLDGNMLHIHRAAVHGEGGKMFIETTKTYSSDRYVMIPEELADRIRKQGYVTKYTPTALSHYYDYFMRKNGFPHYRLHDLRHFFVSYCHNVLHLSDAQIQAITGHKTSVVMRANYLHPMHQKEAAQKVAENIARIV